MFKATVTHNDLKLETRRQHCLHSIGNRGAKRNVVLITKPRKTQQSTNINSKLETRIGFEHGFIYSRASFE